MRTLTVAVLCVLLWLVALPRPWLGNWRSYTPDSAAYVEVSRSLRAGEGLTFSASRGCEAPVRSPLRLWPPGFPVAMAGVQALGVPAPESGVLISMVCAALFVALAAWMSALLLSGAAAVLAPLAVAVTPALVISSPMCWSDATYLLLAGASLAGLLRARRVARGRGWWMAAAGVLAGLSWGVRYVGASLIVAEAVFVIGLAALARDHRRAPIAWVAGVVIGAAPFALRLLATFGTLLPYDPAGAGASWSRSAAEFARAAVVGVGAGATYMGPSHAIPGVTLAGLMAAALLAISLVAVRRLLADPRSAGAWLATHGDAVLLGLYAASYAGAVLMGRTRYHWGEAVGARHLMQVVWIGWLLFAYGAPRLGARGRAARVGPAAVLFVAIALYLRADLWWARNDVWPVPPVVASGAADTLLARVGPRQIVLSTADHVLRLHGVRAQPLLKNGHDDVRCLEEAGTLWGIVVEDVPGARAGAYGPTVRRLVERPEGGEGFVPLATGGGALVFRRRLWSRDCVPR